MQRSKHMDAACATGDPEPLLAAAASLPESARAERALYRALAKILGADVTSDPAAVDRSGARWLAREHLARLETDAARPWVIRAEDGALRAWCDVLEGAHEGVRFEELRGEARAAGRSAEVVELTALEALARAQGGGIAEAEAIARRGVRMAATEELPESAFLANLVLARLRRLGGRPHLTTHILATLSRYAPPAWRRWIDWERALAFGVGAPDERSRARRRGRSSKRR